MSMSRMEIDSAADVNDKMEVDMIPVVNNEELDKDIAEGIQVKVEEECSFLKLPSEIRIKIFNHVSQKDIIQARKCSSELRYFVDKFIDFYAMIHDEKTDLSRIYQLRIKDCLITRYLKDCEIFQFPQVLRRLRLWGPITGHNFRRILRVAVDNEELSFTRFGLGQENLFLKNEFLPGFGKLKALELLGYTCRDTSGPVEIISNNANNILSYKMPFIKKLAINFNCYTEELDGISKHLFNFLADHSSIENLNVSLVPVSSAERSHEQLGQIRNNRSSIVLRSHVNNGRRLPRNMVEEKEKWVITPEIIEKLKGLQLKIFRLTTSPYDYSCYEALIENQRNLVDFRVRWAIAKCDPPNRNHQENQIPIGISWTLFKSPILASAATLTCVDLKGITLPVTANQVEISFDASIFSKAQNLRRLVLHRSPDDLRRNFGEQPSMMNIINIPDSVQELEILRFRLISSDLQVLVDSLTKLTNITLLRTGGSIEFGVHGGIISSIMENPTIKTMSITCINFSNKEENVKYEEMKKKYKFSLSSEDHLYYDFERYRKGEEQPKYYISPRPVPTLTITEHHFFDDTPNNFSTRSRVFGMNPLSKEKFNRKLPHRQLRELVKTSAFYSAAFKKSTGLSTLLNTDKDLPQFVNYNQQQQQQQNGCCSTISINGPGPSSSSSNNMNTATTTTTFAIASSSSTPPNFTFVRNTTLNSDEPVPSTSKQTPTIIFRDGRYFMVDDGDSTSDESDAEV